MWGGTGGGGRNSHSHGNHPNNNPNSASGQASTVNPNDTTEANANALAASALAAYSAGVNVHNPYANVGSSVLSHNPHAANVIQAAAYAGHGHGSHTAAALGMRNVGGQSGVGHGSVTIHDPHSLALAQQQEYARQLQLQQEAMHQNQVELHLQEQQAVISRREQMQHHHHHQHANGVDMDINELASAEDDGNHDEEEEEPREDKPHDDHAHSQQGGMNERDQDSLTSTEQPPNGKEITIMKSQEQQPSNDDALISINDSVKNNDIFPSKAEAYQKIIESATATHHKSTTATMPTQAPRGKPEAMATALAAARIKREQEEQEDSKENKASTLTSKNRSTKKKKSTASTSTARKKRKPTSKSAHQHPSMEDPTPPITEAEYENLVKLMEQFCKVPLLAEFSRPVALLHPELIPIYSKIVKHPVDLGKVCRKVRRRHYKNLRAVRLDMWRIFSNCIKYHTHHNNRDHAVPSFVSISLHLREYFNTLWQEFMLPNEAGVQKLGSSQPNAHNKKEWQDREAQRQKRRTAIGATYVSARCLQKTANEIEQFLKSGGCVDLLDAEPILPRLGEDDDMMDGDEDTDVLIENFQSFKKKLSQKASTAQEMVDDCTVDDFLSDFEQCCKYVSPSGNEVVPEGNNTTAVVLDDPNIKLFQNRPVFQKRMQQRLDRLMGKILCPIYEANGRGVNQSSIWGCMAAAIWARESSKKPFWPALVLGILAPDDQKEDWHISLTNRNEGRLPEKLRAELLQGKRRAELALRRQSQGVGEQMSFFLAEFMGTHEFIWVKESDIIESFDPDDDPNSPSTHGNKKKRSSRHNVGDSKTYATAIEEAKWSLEEFEMQLQDTCGDLQEGYEEEEEGAEEQDMNYDYSVLCQSEEEDSDNNVEEREEEYNPHYEQQMTLSDIEEANELLATSGLLDFTVLGRKEAKKRLAARKKLKADAEKAALKKEKSEQAKQAKRKKAQKEKLLKKQSKSTTSSSSKTSKAELNKLQREEKKEQREMDKRRRKRARERERVLREVQKKKKRRTGSAPQADSARFIQEKRGRANSIVRGYLTRMFAKQPIEDNTMTIPASVVDSSGLLGMALAFRAAAGEICLSEKNTGNAGDASFSKHAPWIKLDAERPSTTSIERTASLTRQMQLLQREIARVKQSTKRRKELSEGAQVKKGDNFSVVLDAEKAARKSNMKKRKKYVKGGHKAKTKTTIVKEIGITEAINEKEKDAGRKKIVTSNDEKHGDRVGGNRKDHDYATKGAEGGSGDAKSTKHIDDDDESKKDNERASDSENDERAEEEHTLSVADYNEDGEEDTGVKLYDDEEDRDCKEEEQLLEDEQQEVEQFYSADEDE